MTIEEQSIELLTSINLNLISLQNLLHKVYILIILYVLLWFFVSAHKNFRLKIDRRD
jgi:hypothetical protein